MLLHAAAKINLHLRVGPPRADGFHPLLTWMCTVGLFDTLIVGRSREQGGGEIHLECDAPGVPGDDRNLVKRAAVAMARELAGTTRETGAGFGLWVRLLKRTPVGAGLGGGSSDGARILEALNVLWNANWPRERLAAFAAEFGSDLPFFFFRPSAICRGRGELVEPLGAPAPRSALLIFPGRMMPTAAVYRRFDGMGLGRPAVIENEPDFNDWLTLPAVSLLENLVNDLEPAAFSIDPDLEKMRRDLEQMLGRRVLMSGSGSTLFTLFDDPAEASAAEKVMAAESIRSSAVELAPPDANDAINVLEAER